MYVVHDTKRVTCTRILYLLYIQLKKKKPRLLNKKQKKISALFLRNIIHRKAGATGQ